MLIGILFCKWPDIEEAKQIDFGLIFTARLINPQIVLIEDNKNGIIN